MKIFKDVMCIVNATLGSALFGNAIGQAFSENYKTATILLLIAAMLFIVGYFVERFSK